MENGEANDVPSAEQTVAVTTDAAGDGLQPLEPIPCKPLPTSSEDSTMATAENVTDGQPAPVSSGESPSNGVEHQAVDGTVENEQRTVADGQVDGEVQFDAEGYKIEGRRETEQTSHSEEFRERADGTEEVVLHESKEVVLEELKSKETERSATEDELRALLDAELNKTGEEEVEVEIAIGKDILVEEYTRVESSREAKVGGEVAKSTTTVTEEHKSEEIHETPLNQNVLVNGFKEKDEEAEPEAPLAAEAAQPVESAQQPDEQPAEPAAAAEDAPPAADAEQANETAEPSTSTDDAKGKDKSPKSKGFISFLKSKARSQSREREESKEPKEEPKEGDGKTEEPAKRGGTLEREQQKKFKLNIFGKKSDDEKAEKAADEEKPEGHAEGEATDTPSKSKLLKMPLFGKKKDKATADEGHEKKDQETAAGAEKKPDESDSKAKDKKWFHFGKKKENAPQVADAPDGGDVAAETAQTEEAGDDKNEATTNQDDGEKDAGQNPNEAEQQDGEHVVAAIEVTSAEPTAEADEPKEEKTEHAGDEETEERSKDVSPGGTLKSDTDEKDAAKTHKKFSFGLKFGKKTKVPKSESTDDHKKEGEAVDGEQPNAEAAGEHATDQHDGVAAQPEETKPKTTKHKLFSFGKLMRSKSKDVDESAAKTGGHDAEAGAHAGDDDEIKAVAYESANEETPAASGDAKEETAAPAAEPEVPATSDVAEVVEVQQASAEEVEQEQKQPTEEPSAEPEADVAISVEKPTSEEEEVCKQEVDHEEVVQTEEKLQEESKEVVAVSEQVVEVAQPLEEIAAPEQPENKEAPEEEKQPEEVVVEATVEHEVAKVEEQEPPASEEHKEGTEETDVQKETAELEAEVKKDQKESKKFSFGIKFGQKKEPKTDEGVTEEAHKHKETAHWNPFGKKTAKKSVGETEKPAAEAFAEEAKAAEDAAPEAAAEGQEAATEEKTAEEPKEKKDEKTINIRLPKLFSFGKKDKSVDEKINEPEAKEEEHPAEGQDAEAAATEAKPEAEEAEQKHPEETDAEKKDETKKPTGIRKLFSLGKRGKDGEEKKEGEAAAAAAAEEEAAAGETQPKDGQTSPETKQKHRSKSPHKKFSFDIKLGKKKDKEEAKTEQHAAAAAAEEGTEEQKQPQEESAAVAATATLATPEDETPEPAVGEQAPQEDVTVCAETEVAVESAAVQQQAAPVDEGQDGAVAEAVVVDEVPKVEVTVEVSSEAETTEEHVEETSVVTTEQSATVETQPEIENVPAQSIPVPEEQSTQPAAAEPATDTTEPAESASVEAPKPEEKAAPESATSTPINDASAREHKARRRFPFNIKFGRRAERAKSAERVIETPKQKATATTSGNAEGLEKKTKFETSASVPDVHMHAKEYDDEAEDADKEEQQKAAEAKPAATETPSKGRESSMRNLGIKWPHFGKKAADKDKDAVDPGAADVTTAAEGQQPPQPAPASAEESQESTPKKQPATPKTSLLGKGTGIFNKIFSPRKDPLHKSPTTGSVDGTDKEQVVSYSVGAEGQIVAETQWRPRSMAGSDTSSRAGTLTRSSTVPVDPDLAVAVVAEPVAASAAADASAFGSPGYFVVVAIDFGTTYSGYAFSFARDARTAAGQSGGIHMMRRWEGGDPGVVNQKTPTTMLLTANGEFHSFGFTARDFYHDLDPAEACKWMFFEKFKMALHNTADLNAETTIAASNGREFPALQLFAMALRYFKEHALKELSSQSATIIVNEDVRWVITVPAIWKAPAKQFMRQAAYEAGIASTDCPDNLLIALEPEAASIYVRQLRMSQLVPDRTSRQAPTTPSHKEVQNGDGPAAEPVVNGDAKETEVIEHLGDEFHAGTRYMVVDCGGGTVDITVHEMENDSGNLKELFKATGGPFGSTGVDREFEKLLGEIFGVEFIDSFKTKRPAGWVDLMIAFESRKRAASPHKASALNVSLPFSFIDFHKKHFGSQVEAAIKRYGDKDIHWSMQGMLRLMPDAMMRLFQPTLDSIKNAIAQVLSNQDVSGMEYLFLVGGFAESPILQFEIRKEFEHVMKIIIPQEVSLTILKGAVCFGLDPTVVTVRRSRLTYGVGVMNRFVRGVHPESKLVRREAGDASSSSEWCRDVFDRFVAADHPVALGDTVMRRYTPAGADQTTTVIHIYSAETPEPRFVTDDGVRRCGTLRLELSAVDDGDRSSSTGGRPGRREIQTRMTFGDTEIKVWALDVASGRSVRAAIDFLNK